MVGGEKREGGFGGAYRFFSESQKKNKNMGLLWKAEGALSGPFLDVFFSLAFCPP